MLHFGGLSNGFVTRCIQQRHNCQTIHTSKYSASCYAIKTGKKQSRILDNLDESLNSNSNYPEANGRLRPEPNPYVEGSHAPSHAVQGEAWHGPSGWSNDQNMNNDSPEQNPDSAACDSNDWGEEWGAPQRSSDWGDNSWDEGSGGTWGHQVNDFFSWGGADSMNSADSRQSGTYQQDYQPTSHQSNTRTDTPYNSSMGSPSSGPRSRYSSSAFDRDHASGYGAGHSEGGSSRFDATGSTWDAFAEQGSGGEGGREGQGTLEGDMPTGSPSDITVLSRSEMEAVLPVLPNGRQAAYYQPKTLQERLVQVMGSIGASMMLSKSVVLAAPALLYPIWSPWLQAGAKNLEMYTKGLKCLGLWRAKVLEVEVVAGTPFAASWAYGARASAALTASVRVLLGDPWTHGARVQLEFPYQPKADLLRQGDSVEALVLGRDEGFDTFKVIREVYAPGLGLWLAEYPFVDRGAFLDISLQIERSRQVATGNDGSSGPMGFSGGPLIVDVDAVPAGEQGAPFQPPMYHPSSSPSSTTSNMYDVAGYAPTIPVEPLDATHAATPDFEQSSHQSASAAQAETGAGLGHNEPQGVGHTKTAITDNGEAADIASHTAAPSLGDGWGMGGTGSKAHKMSGSRWSYGSAVAAGPGW